jgi:hypothetical protein
MDIKNFRIHPRHMRYAADKNGKVLDLSKNEMLRVQTTQKGCKQIYIYIKPKYKIYLLDRFVNECFNGVVSTNNLERKKPHRDYTVVKDNHRSRKQVKSTCIETGEIKLFNSLYGAQKELGINAGLVKMCCEGTNNVKSGKSKFIEFTYTFEYAN